MRTCPVKSGQLNFRSLKEGTFVDGHKMYAETVKQTGRQPIALDHFTELLHQWGFQPARYDKYTCPYFAKEVIPKAHKELINRTFGGFADSSTPDFERPYQRTNTILTL